MSNMDLLQLRGAMKRDPKAYEDELRLQLRHFQVLTLTPFGSPCQLHATRDGRH